jgi:hypothetical protein
MKKEIFNRFHDVSAVISIKDIYFRSGNHDALAMLEYEKFSRGDDRIYAKRKLKEIKEKLCGASVCRCVNTINEV